MAGRKRLISDTHIEADYREIIPVFVSYSPDEVLKDKIVEVKSLTTCHYEDSFHDLGDTFLVQIDDLCDVEFDEEGKPISESLESELYYFLDENMKRVACRRYRNNAGASVGFAKIKVFSPCKKHRGDHPRRESLFIQDFELKEVRHVRIPRSNNRKKQAIKIVMD
ncbi:hypothetical protein ACFLZK_01170 [Patescibacteria group bacterium]